MSFHPPNNNTKLLGIRGRMLAICALTGKLKPSLSVHKLVKLILIAIYNFLLTMALKLLVRLKHIIDQLLVGNIASHKRVVAYRTFDVV